MADKPLNSTEANEGWTEAVKDLAPGNTLGGARSRLAAANKRGEAASVKVLSSSLAKSSANMDKLLVAMEKTLAKTTKEAEVKEKALLALLNKQEAVQEQLDAIKKDKQLSDADRKQQSHDLLTKVGYYQDQIDEVHELLTDVEKKAAESITQLNSSLDTFEAEVNENIQLASTKLGKKLIAENRQAAVVRAKKERVQFLEEREDLEIVLTKQLSAVIQAESLANSDEEREEISKLRADLLAASKATNAVDVESYKEIAKRLEAFEYEVSDKLRLNLQTLDNWTRKQQEVKRDNAEKASAKRERAADYVGLGGVYRAAKSLSTINRGLRRGTTTNKDLALKAADAAGVGGLARGSIKAAKVAHNVAKGSFDLGKSAFDAGKKALGGLRSSVSVVSAPKAMPNTPGLDTEVATPLQPTPGSTPAPVTPQAPVQQSSGSTPAPVTPQAPVQQSSVAPMPQQTLPAVTADAPVAEYVKAPSQGISFGDVNQKLFTVISDIDVVTQKIYDMLANRLLGGKEDRSPRKTKHDRRTTESKSEPKQYTSILQPILSSVGPATSDNAGFAAADRAAIQSDTELELLKRQVKALEEISGTNKKALANGGGGFSVKDLLTKRGLWKTLKTFAKRFGGKLLTGLGAVFGRLLPNIWNGIKGIGSFAASGLSKLWQGVKGVGAVASEAAGAAVGAAAKGGAGALGAASKVAKLAKGASLGGLAVMGAQAVVPEDSTAGKILNSNTVNGASMGALVGSVVPGIGTLVGGAVGAVGGAAMDLYDYAKSDSGAKNLSSVKQVVTQTAKSTVDTAKDVTSLAGGSLKAAAGKLFNVKSDVNLDGVNPSVQSNFTAMAAEYKQQGGKGKIQINSAYRSNEEQAALYARDPSKAAPPGKSAHGTGLAIDINSKEANELNSMGLLSKYGFARPVKNEAWHLQAAGTASSLAAAGGMSADSPKDQQRSSVSQAASSQVTSSVEPVITAVPAAPPPVQMAQADSGGGRNSSGSGGVSSATTSGVVPKGSTNSIPNHSYMDGGLFIMNSGLLAS